MSEMKIGFEMRRVRIALADILPVRHVKDPQDNIKRYRTIRASIKEVGLIEPLVVYPQKGAPGKYLLLDGHLRHYALKDLGRTEAECIIASDDESFTYNARVNRLNPIAEHKMIMKAVNNGVKPEKIAAALNLSEADVKASMTLLDGINEEAADLLKDKAVSPKAIRLMRKLLFVYLRRGVVKQNWVTPKLSDYLKIFTGTLPEYRDEEPTGYLGRVFTNRRGEPVLLGKILDEHNVAGHLEALLLVAQVVRCGGRFDANRTRRELSSLADRVEGFERRIGLARATAARVRKALEDYEMLTDEELALWTKGFGGPG